MLKEGGRLVYSTCTFAQAEDEGQVQNYLLSHPEMKHLKQEKLYPHKVQGEGHFVALFEKETKTAEWTSRIKEAKASVTASGEKAYREFEKTFFHAKFARRLYEINGVLYELPQGVFEWKGLQVLRVGVRLGEVKNGRFEPSHSLAMCVQKSECKNVVDLTEEDSRVQKYLRGETFEEESVKNGWCVVCMHGLPLGLGKAVNGVVKNHLPKGIRAFA
jgi:NOL1/NOP2/fmu family ribosome biogenesis protein